MYLEMCRILEKSLKIRYNKAKCCKHCQEYVKFFQYQNT